MTKTRRRGNATPFPSKTPFEKKLKNSKVLPLNQI
jgi:hypothetical protein